MYCQLAVAAVVSQFLHIKVTLEIQEILPTASCAFPQTVTIIILLLLVNEIPTRSHIPSGLINKLIVVQCK